MNWKTITGPVPTDVHYEMIPRDGVCLKIEPVYANDWPAFRWIVHINFGGRVFHHEETAVDLPSAKQLAENYLRLTLIAFQKSYSDIGLLPSNRCDIVRLCLAMSYQ